MDGKISKIGCNSRCCGFTERIDAYINCDKLLLGWVSCLGDTNNGDMTSTLAVLNSWTNSNRLNYLKGRYDAREDKMTERISCHIFLKLSVQCYLNGSCQMATKQLKRQNLQHMLSNLSAVLLERSYQGCILRQIFFMNQRTKRV